VFVKLTGGACNTVVIPDIQKDGIRFTVMDHDVGSSDDSIGEAYLPVQHLIQNLEYDTWLPLHHKKKHYGDIHVGVTSLNFGNPAGYAQPLAPVAAPGQYPPNFYAPPGY
jgi:hypothetical protein